MGQNAHSSGSHRGYVTIDWFVLTVACVALLFLLGTLLRTTVDPDEISAGSFNQLAGQDTLLAYQDFNFGAPGWSPAETSDRLPGLGPVLGPFSDAAVQRSFAMHTDATTAQITFDIHLIGDWAGQGGVHISLGEEEVLTVNVPEGASLGEVAFDTVQTDTVNIAVRSDVIQPRPSETALPGTADAFASLRVRMTLADPAETLVLRLNADVEGDAAQWSLDNLTVVATSGDGVTQP
ncbi:hypothetical protein K3728_01375 [Rhodobacteraceae bacterium M385]|nr:hypothetical protein K3728_01375 [Rhodobacteraceae bacterium M385]